MYIYIYICNHENNVPSWLSPQWLCGNSSTWAHYVRYMVHMLLVPKSVQQAKAVIQVIIVNCYNCYVGYI